MPHDTKARTPFLAQVLSPDHTPWHMSAIPVAHGCVWIHGPGREVFGGLFCYDTHVFLPWHTSSGPAHDTLGCPCSPIIIWAEVLKELGLKVQDLLIAGHPGSHLHLTGLYADNGAGPALGNSGDFLNLRFHTSAIELPALVRFLYNLPDLAAYLISYLGKCPTEHLLVLEGFYGIAIPIGECQVHTKLSLEFPLFEGINALEGIGCHALYLLDKCALCLQEGLGQFLRCRSPGELLKEGAYLLTHKCQEFLGGLALMDASSRACL